MMKISEVINRLQEIQKEYGDLDIVCYDNSANNIGLLDGTIIITNYIKITIFFLNFLKSVNNF